MAQTRWYRERQNDSYFKAAKKAGYRARSAYKLQQINNKFGLIKPGDATIDLGCAPGGWAQVLVEMVGDEGLVLGVDLQKTRPLEGATFIQGDFTQEKTRARLTEILAESDRSDLDVVVSDMAPDMSGNYDLDQYRSVHLGTLAVEFADKHLKIGGHFICKVFEGADFMELREMVLQRFRKVRQVHPAASRKQSSEVYLVGLGYKGTAGVKKEEEEDDPYEAE